MNDTTRKITVTLPQDLVEFADNRAGEHNISRSKVVGMALWLAK